MRERERKTLKTLLGVVAGVVVAGGLLALGCSGDGEPLGESGGDLELAAPPGGPPGQCSDDKYPKHVAQILSSNQPEPQKREKLNRLNEKCGHDEVSEGSNVWVINPDGSGIPAGTPCGTGFCYFTTLGDAGWYFPDDSSRTLRVVISTPIPGLTCGLVTVRDQGPVCYDHQWIPNFPKPLLNVTVEHCNETTFTDPTLAKNVGPDDPVSPAQPGTLEGGIILLILAFLPPEAGDLPACVEEEEFTESRTAPQAGTSGLVQADGKKAGSGLALAGDRGIGGLINSTTNFGIVEGSEDCEYSCVD